MSYKPFAETLMYGKIVFLMLQLRIAGLILVFSVLKWDLKIEMSRIISDRKI